MANREIYPNALYPLIGDVQSTAGNNTAVVVGIQGIPVLDTFLDGGSVLEYNANTNNWEPTLRAAVQVNNMTASDDYIISVNVTTPVAVNGS